MNIIKVGNKKMTIKLKRIYDAPAEDDGYRVLVDKLWPRGVKKSPNLMNYWAKEITPTDEMRKTFHADMENNWDAFRKSYKKMLEHSEALDSLIHSWRVAGYSTVTLLYASKAPKNHALILKDVIEKKLG